MITKVSCNLIPDNSSEDFKQKASYSRYKTISGSKFIYRGNYSDKTEPSVADSVKRNLLISLCAICFMIGLLMVAGKKVKG